MARPTEPRQPVVYEMMLLVDALVALRKMSSRRITTSSPEFAARQKEFEIALTKIRSLAQFMSSSRGNNLIKITDAAFGGTVNNTFERQWCGPISEYLSHLNVQRYRKEPRHRRPNVGDARTVGKQILDILKPLMDTHRDQLRGDAARWYAAFEERYGRL
jgi:hypothetical protein